MTLASIDQARYTEALFFKTSAASRAAEVATAVQRLDDVSGSGQCFSHGDVEVQPASAAAAVRLLVKRLRFIVPGSYIANGTKQGENTEGSYSHAQRFKRGVCLIQ